MCERGPDRTAFELNDWVPYPVRHPHSPYRFVPSAAASLRSLCRGRSAAGHLLLKGLQWAKGSSLTFSIEETSRGLPHSRCPSWSQEPRQGFDSRPAASRVVVTAKQRRRDGEEPEPPPRFPARSMGGFRADGSSRLPPGIDPSIDVSPPPPPRRRQHVLPGQPCTRATAVWLTRWDVASSQWQCECGNWNWARRMACNKCHESRKVGM